MIDVRYTPYLWPLIVVFHIEFENMVPGIKSQETLSWLNHLETQVCIIPPR